MPDTPWLDVKKCQQPGTLMTSPAWWRHLPPSNMPTRVCSKRYRGCAAVGFGVRTDGKSSGVWSKWPNLHILTSGLQDTWYILIHLSSFVKVFFWFIVAFFHIQNNIQVTPLEAGWVDLTFDASTTCQWLWSIITDGSKVKQTLVKSFRNHRSVTERVSLECCAVQIPLS